jgi:hypothetical protein
MGNRKSKTEYGYLSVGAPNGATIKDGASPYNNQLELTARGRHGARLREPRAGGPPPPYLPVRRLRPCSQLSWALYGRFAEMHRS